MNVQLRHTSTSNLKPSRFSSSGCSWVIFLLGLLHLNFNQFLWHEVTICSLYLQRFHLQYASHGHLLKEWCSCWIPKVGHFLCVLSVHNCMVALWLFNKDEGVVLNHSRNLWWHSLLTSTIYFYHLSFTQRRHMECSVSYFSFNVVICSSLNDAAFNILNDVLKICGLVGSLLFNGFSVFDGFLVCHHLEYSLSDRWHGNVLLKHPSCTFKKMCWSCFLVAASLTAFLWHIWLTFEHFFFFFDSILFTRHSVTG